MAYPRGLDASTWSAQLAERTPESRAVVGVDDDWSTADLFEMAGRAAAWLDELGVDQGTTVPALLWASPDAVALVIAGATTGRPIALIGPQLTAREITAVLAGVEGAVMVADREALDVARRVATPDRVAVTLPRFASRPPSEPVTLAGQPDAVAVVLHTSGTSGVPKRVELRQSVLAARTRVNGALLDLGPGDVYVTAKPIHHVGGLGLTLVALGAGAALVPMRRFGAESWSELAACSPTHASVVPAMIETLLVDGRLALPSLRTLQYGGAPIRPATLARLATEYPELDVVALYGQTEGSPITSLSPDDHRAATTKRPDLLDTAGRAAPGVELRIVPLETSAGVDGPGEIHARADHFAKPGDDGWLRTGDIGRLDADGYLRIVGRLGDVITRGGENVHPGEVERILAMHSHVADVAVAALPHDRLGQTVGAWIVPTHADPPPDAEELRAFARGQLAGFKVPTHWFFRAELPRNANGKIVRSLLAAD